MPSNRTFRDNFDRAKHVGEMNFETLTARMMQDKTPFPVVIDTTSAWELVGWLQLVYRHPQLTPYMRGEIVRVGNAFAETLMQRIPELRVMIEDGWRREQDVVGPTPEMAAMSAKIAELESELETAYAAADANGVDLVGMIRDL